MTLSLYGKSRGRQWMLVGLALFALLGAMAATMGLWARAGADSTQFAVYTSIENITDTSECENGGGTGVNCNIYSAKESVYLNGGPSTSFLPDGYYCFSVYNPNTDTLLSSDLADQRTFQVSDGDILYSGNHDTGIDSRTVADDELTIQFFPYNDTSNPGGVYKFALYQYASAPAAGVGNECSQTGITVTKTDNFKVGTIAPSIAIDKTNDTGDNIVNPGESFNWIITLTVTGAVTSADTSITDTIPADFTAGTPVETSTYLDCQASSGNDIDCTLDEGAPVGEYTITVPVDVSEEPDICGAPITNTAVAQMGTETPLEDDDTVTINCGVVASSGLILVEKYIEIDGNLATTLPGEGLVAGWTVTVDGTSKQTTLPATVSFEATVGEMVAVSETAQAAYNVLGHSINGGGLLVGSSTNILVTEATTLVRFYNQPFGSLNVNKVAVTSLNGGPDVAAPNDDDGWTITVVSAACGINQSSQTDASGNASFTNLPLCSDYVVSENTLNADSPNFVPVGPSSVASVTPTGQTITFTNRLATIHVVIITPTPVIITPTNTPVLPTATPTNTPVLPTATPTNAPVIITPANTPVPPTATPTNTTGPAPIEEEAVAGVKTPGPTPLAPSTGTGTGPGSGGSANINILLMVAGLAVLSGAMTMAAAGRRRRN